MKILAIYKTQHNFARICGISDYRLSKIIHWKIDPSEREKRMMADRLGVEYPDNLFVKQNSHKGID